METCLKTEPSNGCTNLVLVEFMNQSLKKVTQEKMGVKFVEKWPNY